MLRIHEWPVKRAQRLACSHRVEPGSEAYMVTLVVCGHDVARTTQACVQGLRMLRQEPWRPSLLYRLWHFLWGKKKPKTQARSHLAQASDTPRRTPLGQTQCCIARQTLHLDCGHTVKAGESYQFTNLYTCGQEGVWPLTVLLACVRLWQQLSAVPADRVQGSA